MDKLDTASDLHCQFYQHLQHSAATQAISSGLQLLCGVVIARSLGPVGKGEMTLVLWLAGCLHTIWYLGLGEAIIALFNRNAYPRQRLVDTLNASVLGLIIIAGVIYVVSAPWGLAALQGQLSRILYLGAFCLFCLTMLWADWTAVLLASGCVRAVNWGRVLNHAILLALLLAGWVWGSDQTIMVLGAFVLAAGLELLYIARALCRQVRLRLGWDSATAGELFRTGRKVVASIWLEFLSRRVDIALATMVGGLSGVGLYAVAMGLRDAALVLPQTFLRPVLSVASRAEPSQGMLLIVQGARRAGLFLVIIAVAMAWMLPWIIDRLYSSAFADAVVPARWLLVGFVAGGVSDILAMAFVGFGKPNVAVVSRALILGVLAVGGVLGAKAAGISGIAMAVSLSQVIGLVSFLVCLRRSFPAAFRRLMGLGQPSTA